MGYGIEDAEALAKVSNIYFKVGDDIASIDEASQSVVSTMKAFGIEAQDAMGIIDIYNKIGNEFAVTSGDIGKAMQSAGAALQSSNNTLAESVALWTAMNEILQDGDVAATSVRFITQRMRNTAGELQEMGEDAEGAAESITKLQQQIQSLTGVNIFEADGETFRSTYDVLDDISKVWDELTDKDRADVTRLLSGTRQSSSFNALMTNFEQARKAVEAANNATGSAMTEHARWMESIGASEARATASWEEFSNAVMSSELIKFYYDAKSGILGFLTEIVETLGAIPTLATAASAALSFKNKGISNMNMPRFTGEGATA